MIANKSILEKVPKSFFEKITLDAIKVYHVAESVPIDLHPKLAKNGKPYLFWIFFENLMLECARDTEGVKYKVVTKKNGSSHVEVRTGGVLITAHQVKNVDDIVRTAKYRQTLVSEALPLFPKYECKPNDESNKKPRHIYAHIIHGTPTGNPEDLFVRFCIPSRCGKKYYLAEDLFEYCGTIPTSTETSVNETGLEPELAPGVGGANAPS